ncbi:MAG TPA: hypothetical protein VJ327_06315 [Patescibacteria group bacterium]|nr:hypothetical protein [Patescibacteria group bacterium]
MSNQNGFFFSNDDASDEISIRNALKETVKILYFGWVSLSPRVHLFIATSVTVISLASCAVSVALVSFATPSLDASIDFLLLIPFYMILYLVIWLILAVLIFLTASVIWLAKIAIEGISEAKNEVAEIGKR